MSDTRFIASSHRPTDPYATRRNRRVESGGVNWVLGASRGESGSIQAYGHFVAFVLLLLLPRSLCSFDGYAVRTENTLTDRLLYLDLRRTEQMTATILRR